MKKHPPTPEKQSRRNFTKAIAGAFVSVPLASSLANAQRGLPKKTKLAGPQKPDAIARRSDHIPPTVLGDQASFSIELQHKLTYKGGLAGPSARPKVYTGDVALSGERYADIARVQVITEYEEYYTYWSYDFWQGYNAQLKIWLQDVPFDPTPIPPDSPSQIVIKGNYQPAGSLPKTIWLEMNEEKLDAPKKIKPKARREYRNEHKDNPNKEFRIRKWWLTRSNGVPISGFGGDSVTPETVTGYRIMISFYGD